jgi:hypothetical protein
LQELRRARDVCEQERDGSGGKIAPHGVIMRSGGGSRHQPPVYLPGTDSLADA